MEERLCFVVERIEWDEDLDGSHEYWEDRHICRAFYREEDAKAFCVENAAGLDFACRWSGTMAYTGRAVFDGKHEYGIRYEIHRIWLC